MTIQAISEKITTTEKYFRSYGVRFYPKEERDNKMFRACFEVDIANKIKVDKRIPFSFFG